MIARLAITVAILAILAMGIDMGLAARALATIDLSDLALVLGLVAIDRAVMILRWILLLRASGNAISTADAIRLFLVSSFVGSFLPAGVGGDAARAYGLARETTTGSEALASVAVDRLLGVLSLVLMAVVGVLAWTPEGRSDWRIALAIAAVAVACMAVFWANEWLRWVIPAQRHERFFTRRVLRLTDAVSRYRDRRGVLVHVMAWSIVVQLLRITQGVHSRLGPRSDGAVQLLPAVHAAGAAAVAAPDLTASAVAQSRLHRRSSGFGQSWRLAELLPVIRRNVDLHGQDH